MKLLRKLPNKSSTDGDGISYVILKNGGSSVAFYLAKLFSVSLETCRLPTAWKTAIVSPIFKSGTRTSIANYRPISVTSCCCCAFTVWYRDWSPRSMCVRETERDPSVRAARAFYPLKMLCHCLGQCCGSVVAQQVTLT